VHTYGTDGIIARATVKLEPLQDWHAPYASFETFGPALAMVRALRELEPCPRLVPADRPPIVDALPSDPAIPQGRASLRSILDARTVSAAIAMVSAAGGRPEEVRTGPRAAVRVSMLSYNHPIYWLQRSAPPNTYFHVEVARDALIDRFEEVEAVYSGGVLHIEAGHELPFPKLSANISLTRFGTWCSRCAALD